MTLTIAGLVIYPVKGCRGIAREASHVDPRGLRHDRVLMVVDNEGGAVTQRTDPSLATVATAVHESSLTLTTPAGSVEVPLDTNGPPSLEVTVWGRSGTAIDMGDGPAALLSEHIGRRVRLVGCPRDGSLFFADAHPLLIAAQESLEALNRRLELPIPMDRFRPNIVVSGGGAFAEDSWAALTPDAPEGPDLIHIVKPCVRCTVTTIDQATGTRAGAEPLRALGTFRRAAKGVIFGVNARAEGNGTLRIGQPLTAIQPE